MLRVSILVICLTIVLHAQEKPVPKESPSAKTGALPPLTGALAERAAHAFSKGDFQSARLAYREMLETQPDNALAWANLGAVEQRLGNIPEAVDAFDASVHFNPQLVQSWIALGSLLAERGDHYRAISAFARAIHEDPLDARGHNYLAIEALALGWRDTALEELQRALEINPEYGLAHFNLAALYLDQKPPARALAQRHYDKALAVGVEKDEVLERRLQVP
jgi:tetratricopeptide (TPR) repeat protein